MDTPWYTVTLWRPYGHMPSRYGAAVECGRFLHRYRVWYTGTPWRPYGGVSPPLQLCRLTLSAAFVDPLPPVVARKNQPNRTYPNPLEPFRTISLILWLKRREGVPPKFFQIVSRE